MARPLVRAGVLLAVVGLGAVMLVPGLERPAFAVLPQLSGVGIGPTLIVSETSPALDLARESRALAEQDRLEEALAKAEDALALARAELGDGNATTGIILGDLATLSYDLGRFTAALGYAEQAVAIIAAARGRESPDYALLINNQATILMALGRIAEAAPLYEQADAIFLAELGPAHEHTVRTARSLGIAYGEMSQPERARAYFERAVQAEREVHSEQSLEFARALLDRAGIDLELEAPEAARARAEQALAIVQAQDLLDRSELVRAEVMLARADIQQSRIGAASDRLEAALAQLERAGLTQHEVATSLLYNLGAVQILRGQSVEAVATYRRVLELYRQQLGEAHPGVARALHSLAIIYGGLGQYQEAERLYRRAIAILTDALGPGDPSVGASRLEMGLLLAEMGRADEAIAEARAALGIYAGLGGAFKIKQAYATSVLGFALRAAGWREQAADTFERALVMMIEARGPDSADLPPGLIELALIRIEQGRPDQAETLARRAVTIREQSGALTPWGIAKAKSVLALAIARRGDASQALELIDQATDIMRARISIEHRQTTLALGELRNEREVFERHLAIGLPQLIKDDPALRARLFEVAQLPHLTTTAAAVTRMAARFARGDDELAKALWQRERTVDRWAAVQAQLVDVRASEVATERADELRAQVDDLDAQIDALDDRLRLDFADFAELIRPRPVPLSEIVGGALLNPGEAILIQVTGPEATYLAFADGRGARIISTDLTASELTGRVASLRQGLETGPGQQWPHLAPFDVDAAHRLYQALFAPFEAELEGVGRLFFVPDGAMQNITPAVLIRRPAPLPKEAYGQFTDGRLGSLRPFQELDFVGLSLAIAVLPSLSSLKVLRSAHGLGGGTRPFIGFAPFDRQDADVDAKRAGALTDASAPGSAIGLAALPPLPGTFDELASLAGSLGGEVTDVLRDAAATETEVKNRALAEFRVLGFATHGLLANESGLLSEPALVMHRSLDLSAGDDDGLLLASEVAQLELAADWVILSACNTAAAEGKPGAEGLSGLARAFFYAGSRALLVSHWWVDSRSSAFLSTRTMEAWRRDPAAGKASALRQAMRDLAGPRLSRAHPFFWAPFTVVGD